MCRLFGMTGGPRAVGATFWLLQAPDSLSRQSEAEPDGTGLGWFDAEGRPKISKQPLTAETDRAFAREAKTVRSHTFVAHVRYATTGALEKRNTHPFEQDGRLFAHNGMVGDLPALEDELGPALATVHGDTDSERVFALITREIARTGNVGEGIASAVGWIAAHLQMLAVNLVLIDRTDLWALRYPQVHDLFVLERAAGGHDGTAALDHARGGRIRASAEELATAPAVIVATERMDVDASLTLTRSRILDGPPSRPLSLADLEGHAQAAQRS
jgi:predicted glutamine amidotransferase